MTDEQIQELISAFVHDRGSYTVSDSERELFWLVKGAVELERASLLDVFSKRVGMSVATMLEYMPELA